MEIGTEFILYGVAEQNGCLALMEEHRTKTASGSKVVHRQWAGATWPNTKAGMRDAMNWVAELNGATATRLDTHATNMAQVPA